MDIDELQTVQSKERQKDSLQHLRDSFYEDVAAYIQDLKSERDRVAEAAESPFSDPEVSRLTDDIERAEDVVEAVYERRVGKVVKMASFAAADMPVEEEGLTTQERDLFEHMVGRIGENRSRVLDIVAGEGDSAPASQGAAPGAQPESTESTATAEPSREPPAPEPTDASPSRAEPAVGTGTSESPPETGDTADAAAADAQAEASSEEPPAAPPDTPPASSEEETPAAPPEEAMDPRSDGGVAAEPPMETGGPSAEASAAASERSTPAESDDGDERTTVRVTEDVGRMLGVDDREYELRSDDVVALPADNAEALLQREAAERLW